MAMTERDFEVWARLRRMGGIRFVIGIGVLGFGVPFALLFPLFFATAVWLIDGVRLPLRWFAFFGVWSLSGGLIFGLRQWYTSERAYRRWVAGTKRSTTERALDRQL